MEQDNESKDVPGAPLTPNSIPQPKFPRQEEHFRQRTTADPLDFSPKGRFFNFVKVPGIIFFGMVLAYLIGRYRFNMLFVLPVAHIVYFVFKRRVKHFSLTLETLLKEKDRRDAVGEYETVEWLNYIIRKFWEVSEAGVSSEIYSAVNRELKANTPKILKSLKLTELTLGTRPPIVERIGFLNKNEDSIIVEFAMNFIPMQTSEDILFYFGEEKKHWNTCIELTATVGFISLPILVRNFTFSGIFRAEISLTRKIPFLKSFSLCILELPLVDFELHPLKTVDFMDLPYLSRAIAGIINSQVHNLLLFPKNITIDLQNITDYKGAVIGVIYVYVSRLETTDEDPVSIELGVNGRMFAKTAQKTGRFPIFDEGFYEIIRDTTKTIGVTMQSSQEKLTGQIFLRNLNKHRYSEQVHLASETKRRFLNTSTRFFGITKKKTRSAIVNMSLVSINDLQAIGDPKNRVYSTYCAITLETKESIRVRSVINSFETKHIFSTKDPYYNESFSFFVRDFNDYIIKINVMNEKNDAVIGTLVVSMSCVENSAVNRYKIGGVLSGDAEIKFSMEYIHLQDEEEDPLDEVIEINQPSDEGSSEVVTVVPQLTPEEENNARHRKKEMVPGAFVSKKRPAKKFVRKSRNKAKKIKSRPIEDLSIGIYNTQRVSSAFVAFKKAYKFAVEKIKEQGTFYMVFETDHVNCKMEPFSTDLKISRHVIVPIKDETVIRVRLFRMLINGDALVSEEYLGIDDTVVVFDTIRVSLAVSAKDFVQCPASDSSDNLKIVQFKMDNFSKDGKYSVDIFADSVIKNHKLPCLSLLTSGSSDVRCTLKNSNKKHGSFTLPMRTCAETFDLGAGLSCLLTCDVQMCGFKTQTSLDSGVLEIYIIKANNVKGVTDGMSSPYVKVYMNNEKIFKTNRKTNNLSPIFNESLKLSVQRTTDVLGFYICDYSAISVTTIISYKEFSLFNITEGYSKFDIQMNDGEDGNPTDTVLQVIFNFKNAQSEDSTANIYKDWNN